MNQINYSRRLFRFFQSVLIVFLIMATRADTFAETSGNISDLDVNELIAKVNQRQEGSTDLQIVLIQDAHANFECQRNTVEVLRSFHSTEPLSLIMLEGASGLSAGGSIFAVKDPSLNRDLSRFFMSRGQLSAAEFLMITDSEFGNVELYGAEQKDLYLKNLDSFRGCVKQERQWSVPFQDLFDSLTEIKKAVYSSSLLDLDNLQKKYDTGKISFRNYFTVLLEQAKKAGVSDFSQFPNILNQKKAFELEKGLDRKALDNETKVLINKLSDVLEDKDRAQLMGLALKHELHRISGYKFYQNLANMAEKNGISLKKFKNIPRYYEFLRTLYLINEPMLFEEINLVKNSMKENLVENEDQKNLIIADGKLKILKALLDLKLTNFQYNQYQNNPSSYSPGDILNELTAIARKNNVPFTYDPELSDMNKKLGVFNDFYKYAKLRETPMLENTLKKMKEKGIKRSVLITGGFHTQGLSKMLKKKGVSFMVITPKVFDKNAQTRYIRILMGERTPLDNILLAGGVLDVSKNTFLNPLVPEDQELFVKMLMTLASSSSLLRELPDTDKRKQELVEVLKNAQNVMLSGGISDGGDVLTAGSVKLYREGNSLVIAYSVTDKTGEAPGKTENVVLMMSMGPDPEKTKQDAHETLSKRLQLGNRVGFDSIKSGSGQDWNLQVDFYSNPTADEEGAIQSSTLSAEVDKQTKAGTLPADMEEKGKTGRILAALRINAKGGAPADIKIEQTSETGKNVQIAGELFTWDEAVTLLESAFLSCVSGPDFQAVADWNSQLLV
ncbi:MAG: hypothetical protein P9M03_07870, partial [Candidatus Theseobacter exili]|nr:hypothetical protein [Candidatus Theseobacter exili]